MELDKSKLLPDYYYKVKYMGKWRLGHVIEHEGHRYFYILDEGINYSPYFTEEFYPIFRIDSETGEVFDDETDGSFFNRK